MDKTATEMFAQEKYREGYKEGYKEGYQQGFQEGYNARYGDFKNPEQLRP